MGGGSRSNTNLTSIADALGPATPFDRLSDAVLDGLQIVPLAGPIVALALRQLLPRDSAIYLGEFAKEVAERIDKLAENRLDRDYIQSDSFREDVEQVLDGQTLLSQRRKRRYFAAALVNAAARDRPTDFERRRMIDALVRFRLTHLELLAAVAAVSDKMRTDAVRTALKANLFDMNEEWISTADHDERIPHVVSVDEYIDSRIPGLPLDIIKLEWQDLVAEGMADDYPSGMTKGPAWERFRLKSYGEAFVRFVSADERGDGT